MLIKYLFLLLLISCSFSENYKKETFAQKRDKRIYAALKKFKYAMEAKGYRAAGIGEGLDHSTEKQNYLS